MLVSTSSNNICYYFLYIECAKIDGRKSATKKPWSTEEMSAIQSYFKMNIKSHFVLGKKHGGRCASFFQCCKSEHGF